MKGRLRRRFVVTGIVVSMVVTAGAAYAAFSIVTSNTGTSLSADQLAPPTNLNASAPCTASGAVVFRNSSSATGTSGALTISKPADVVAGDTMVAQFALRSVASSITVPSGWNLIRNEQFTNGIQSALYVKVAQATEPASYTWTSNSSARSGGGIVAYSGAAVSPIDVQAGSTGVSTTPTAPSVTTTVNSGFLVTFFVARQQSLASLPPGMTERWNLNTGGGAGSIGVGATDEPRPTAGATGTRAASIGSSFDWTGQSVAIKPAGAAQASLSWTPSVSTFASGYKLQRWLGAVQQNEQTITPVSQTSGVDGPLASNTTYTYKITSFFGTWRSAEVTTLLATPAC